MLRTYVVWSHDPQLSQVGIRGVNGGPWWADMAKNWLARRKNPNHQAYRATQVEEAGIRFAQRVDASAALVNGVTPITILAGDRANAVLSELINRPGLPWHGDAAASGLNWRLVLSELEAEREHLRLDGEPVILYSLLSPPVLARANLLQDLNRLNACMTVSLEWRPAALDAARRKIRSAQRHYFSKRYSMMAHMQETEGTTAAMEDSAAAVESERLSTALVELEANGVAYGDLALTVALHGDLNTIERLDAEIRRIFASADAKVIREGYGQLSRMVRPNASPTPPPANPHRVRQRRHGRVPRALVRAAVGPPDERSPETAGARHLRDALADGLSLRPVCRRRGPYPRTRRDRRR